MRSKSNPPSDYAFTLTKIAVAQICNSIGYTSAETPALQILTDIATRYMRSIAKSAADSANSACRTNSNLVDTIAGVEDLNSMNGYPGAWRVTGSFLHSCAVKEVVKFSKYSEEIPFAKPLPRRIFGVGNGGKGIPSGGSNNKYIGGEKKHIPKWLPVMPVIEKEKEKEIGLMNKGKEQLWGEMERKGEENDDDKGKKQSKGMELPIKRERERGRGKVRFKMGSGVLCRKRGKTDSFM